MFGGSQPAPAPTPSTDAPSTDAPSTDAPSTDAPTTTQSTGCVDDQRWAGAQCGGYTETFTRRRTLYEGSTCCPTGMACYEVNVYHSGCYRQCFGADWTCNNPPTSTAAPTQPTTTTEAPTQPSGSCSSPTHVDCCPNATNHHDRGPDATVGIV